MTDDILADDRKWIVCRICLKESDSDKMQNIFNEAPDNALLERIEQCGGVQLHARSELPGRICPRCLLLLKAAHKFRVLCQRSQKLLQKLFIVERESGPAEGETGGGEIIVELDDDDDGDNTADQETKEFTHYRQFTTSSEVAKKSAGSVFVITCKSEEEAVLSYIVDDEVNEEEFMLQSEQEEYLHEESVSQHTADELTEYNSDEQTGGGIDGVDTIYTTKEPKANSGMAEELNDENAHDDVEEEEQDSDYLGEAPQPAQTKAQGKGKVAAAATKPVKRLVGRPKLKKDATSAPIVCVVCGNVYPDRTKLQVHLRIHWQDKPHECEICHKRFAQTPQLARHMNSHTGNRPYKCKVCPAAFADPSTCYKHERIHTNERPFKCEICAKTFSYSNVLKVHMMWHTGEKPYACPHCDKRFTQQHHMKAHERTHKVCKGDS